MVSVIIPVYNVEKYIDECLKSVVSQTYKNIEVIIINDGSTDKSEEIIRSYLDKYENITYIYQQNKGVSEARNLGLKNATGDYVLFVDSDDYIHKSMIEKMYNNAKIYQSDIVICGHIKFYGSNSSKNKAIDYNRYENKIYSGEEALSLMLSLEVKGYLCDKLFKRSNLIKSKFVLEANRYIEDWFPVIKQINESKVVTFIGEPLYYYRQRSGSALHSINKKLLDDYVYAVNKINNYLNINKIKYDMKCKEVFDCETFYSIIRYFYLNNYKDNLKNKKDIYIRFYQSHYFNYVKFKYSFFINRKINLKLKLKILLWKLKMYHFFIKID